MQKATTEKFDKWLKEKKEVNNSKKTSISREIGFFQEDMDKEGYKTKILNFINEIIHKFEYSSALIYKGDSYLFYKLFNDCIHKAISIHSLIFFPEKNWLNPKRFLKGMDNDFERSYLTSIFPEVDAENGNMNKRMFIDWFEGILEEIADSDYSLEEKIQNDKIIEYFNAIYVRDFLYNHRKVSGTKNVYRSPNPARFTSELHLMKKYYNVNKIKAIVDLRGEKQASKQLILKKDQNFLGFKKYILDFNESGSPEISAPGYVRKLIVRKETIKKSFEIINETNNSVLFHCVSGKDRTGVMVALIQLLIGVEEEEVIKEYTRSGLDCRPERIMDVLKYIKKMGGIREVLKSCNISEDLLDNLSNKVKE